MQGGLLLLLLLCLATVHVATTTVSPYVHGLFLHNIIPLTLISFSTPFSEMNPEPVVVVYYRCLIYSLAFHHLLVSEL